jgi:hypothetical protein
MTSIRIPPESVEFPMEPGSVFQQVIRHIGYPEIPSNRQVQSMIESIISEGGRKIHVNFAFRETRMVSREGPTIAGEGIRIHSRRWGELVEHMEPPQRICAIVITLGLELDHWIRQIQRQSMFEAFIADAFGSVCIERAADRLTREIERQYDGINLVCSRRLSPGYCDWRLDAGQKEIFGFVPTGTMNVSCLPTGLMIPLKTISAIVFAGSSTLWKTPCPVCNDRSCRHRREDGAGAVNS